MSFNLNDRKAIGILIWWIEGADGSIDPSEEAMVAEALDKLDYSLEEFRQKTKMFISGLSNERMKEAVDASISWGSEHYDDQQKKEIFTLLEAVAQANKEERDERKKLNKIQKAWNIS